jgi:hypothetical protein
LQSVSLFVMKKLRLPLLTALLTLALVGLVGLQFYWTNMAYQIARQRFKQSAHEALQTVAQKLEQREIIYATQRSASKLQDSLRIWEAQRQAYEEARMAQLRALEAEKRTSQPKVTPPSPPKNNITINLGSISKKQRLLEDNREIQGYVVFSPDERQKFVFSTGYVNIKQGFDSIQTNFHTKQVNSYYFSELQELKALNDKYEAKSKEVIVNCAPFEIPPAPKKPATPTISQRIWQPPCPNKKRNLSK